MSLSLETRITEVLRPDLPCPKSGESSQVTAHAYTRRGPNRRRRRTAAYGDDDAQPRVPTRLWIRLAELLAWRGELHPCARRIARHLTHAATARGYVGDIESTVIPGYKARHDLGRRTFYADLDRLISAGLLRQTRAACPGRTVGYQMCVPTALPADLPASLAAELRKLWGLRPEESTSPHPAGEGSPAGSGAGSRGSYESHTQDVGCGRCRSEAVSGCGGRCGGHSPVPHPGCGTGAVRVRIPAVQRHQLLADVEMVRLGSSARATPLHAQSSRGRLHTSPLLKRALLHSSRTAAERPPVGRRTGPSGQKIYDEEGLQREVLDRCERIWRQERGGGLTEDAQARLAPLVRGALRYLASSDVIETMTTGTRTARDLGAVLATRLRGVIKAGRRARAIEVDEQAAERGRQEAAAQAAERIQRPAVVAARQSARAAVEAARIRSRERQELQLSGRRRTR